MDDETLVQLVYITIASNRKKVLKAFKGEDTLTPTEISKKSSLHKNTVSGNLKKLRERDYVYVINPDFSRPRLYRLTGKGKKILGLLD
ncbi:MAG: MarR family winged helix-turn-helix transcriptional regulator [Methanobrevibacter ruminantium]|uniref:MarR family winged helix-turn-helix transcriptional regulator n=1 Tax=Methanobrevibacter ruminantium TaxID=83816 RepID=UPI002D807812|nr:MarR family winged helix-turn-helix transcriptional regulator [Methanobrevibacter ruminantium]MCI5737808.1 MarR family winged helix-turn-helix transcriptional regulator [Methanobrevibacter ruminantium]